MNEGMWSLTIFRSTLSMVRLEEKQDCPKEEKIITLKGMSS
jgi:hypothetical protein